LGFPNAAESKFAARSFEFAEITSGFVICAGFWTPALTSERLRKSANRLQLRMLPLCVPAQSLRTSQAVRRHSGAMCVYSSSIATARMGLPVPPFILSGNPMNLNRPLPINFSMFIRPST